MAKSELTAVVEPKCQRLADELGFELVDVALDKEDTGKYLRIYIDKPEGIDIDDCEAFHRAIDPLLDEADPIDSAYYLEVSSPGIERDLTRPEHFDWYRNTAVSVRLYAPFKGKKQWQGVKKCALLLLFSFFICSITSKRLLPIAYVSGLISSEASS
mgnify:CR=1 FL=1